MISTVEAFQPNGTLASQENIHWRRKKCNKWKEWVNFNEIAQKHIVGGIQHMIKISTRYMHRILVQGVPTVPPLEEWFIPNLHKIVNLASVLQQTGVISTPAMPRTCNRTPVQQLTEFDRGRILSDFERQDGLIGKSRPTLDVMFLWWLDVGSSGVQKVLTHVDLDPDAHALLMHAKTVGL